MGIYTIHQPNDSEGTAQSHRNTQLSFPRKRESSIDAGYLDSRLRGNDDLFEMCRYPCPAGEGQDEGCFTGIFPSPQPFPGVYTRRGEGENNAHYLPAGSVNAGKPQGRTTLSLNREIQTLQKRKQRSKSW